MSNRSYINISDGTTACNSLSLCGCSPACFLGTTATATNTSCLGGTPAANHIFGCNGVGFQNWSNCDANAINKAGFYTIFQTANAPTAGDGGLINIPAWMNNDGTCRYNFQLASHLTNCLYYRITNDSGAGTWRAIAPIDSPAFTTRACAPQIIAGGLSSIHSTAIYQAKIDTAVDYQNYLLFKNEANTINFGIANGGTAATFFPMFTGKVTCSNPALYFLGNTVTGTSTGTGIITFEGRINNAGTSDAGVTLINFTSGYGNSKAKIMADCTFCTNIVCANTCFVGSGAGLTGTASTLTANNASCLGGVLASSIAQTAVYSIAAIGWTRIATVTSNISYGKISVTNVYNNYPPSPITFNFGTTYRNAGYITQIAGNNALFSKARIVFPTAADTDYYIEVYSTQPLNTTFLFSLSDSLNATLLGSYTAGSIPVGYSSNELTFAGDGGVSTTGCICASTCFVGSGAGLTGTATSLSANNATCLCGVCGCYYIGGSSIAGSNTATAGTYNAYEISQYKSGFWEVNGAAWTPTTDWYWGLTAAHTSNGPAYNYSMDLIGNGTGTGAGCDFYLRTVGAGTPTSWKRIWTNGDACICTTKYYSIRSTGSSALPVLQFGDTLGGACSDNLSIGNSGGNALIFHTNAANRGSFDASGRFTVSSSISEDIIGYFCNPSSTGYGVAIRAGSSTRYTLQLQDYLGNLKHIFYADGSACSTGTITSNSWMTATDFKLSSDCRVKTRIEPISVSPIDIEYKQFELISEPNKMRYGVIAQELQVNNPELVSANAEGMLSVSYTDLLIKEVAFLKCRVSELEKKIM